MAARPSRASGSVLALALALRLAWVIAAWISNGSNLAFDDERLHWSMARNLIAHGAMRTDDGLYAVRMPLYPLFLACFAAAGDAGILLARLVQAVLGAGVALLALHVARRELGPAAGTAAGVLAACDPFAVFACNLLLTETPYTLLSVALIAATSVARTSRAVAPVIAAAACGVACVMTRQASLGWVALIWSATTWAARGRVERAGRAALFAGLLAAAMLAWGVRNRIVIGEFAWLSTNGGITLYDGQGPHADGSSNQSFVAAHPEIATLPEAARDRAFLRLAMRAMWDDPGRALTLAVAKFRRMWNVFPNLAEFRGGLSGWVSALWTACLLVAALVGSWKLRGRSPLATAAWVTIGYFTLVHCVYVGSVRYRVPLHPFLVLLAVGIWSPRPDGPTNAARAAGV